MGRGCEAARQQLPLSPLQQKGNSVHRCRVESLPGWARHRSCAFTHTHAHLGILWKWPNRLNLCLSRTRVKPITAVALQQNVPAEAAIRKYFKSVWFTECLSHIHDTHRSVSYLIIRPKNWLLMGCAGISMSRVCGSSARSHVFVCVWAVHAMSCINIHDVLCDTHAHTHTLFSLICSWLKNREGRSSSRQTREEISFPLNKTRPVYFD